MTDLNEVTLALALLLDGSGTASEWNEAIEMAILTVEDMK